jgi:hypothetical protein
MTDTTPEKTTDTSDVDTASTKKRKDKPVFDLRDMVTKVRRNDLARANRFAVYIQAPTGLDGSRDVSLLCEEAAIPGLQLVYNPVKIGSWTENRVSNIEFYGDTASFTFFCDTDWEVREYFEKWMMNSVNPYSKEVAFYSDMIGEVTVYALDRINGIVGEWCLKEAFPRVISLTPISHNGGEGAARCTVTFSYKRWVPYEKGDRRSILGQILNLRFGSLESQIKNSLSNAFDEIIDI